MAKQCDEDTFAGIRCHFFKAPSHVHAAMSPRACMNVNLLARAAYLHHPSIPLYISFRDSNCLLNQEIISIRKTANNLDQVVRRQIDLTELLSAIFRVRTQKGTLTTS